MSTVLITLNEASEFIQPILNRLKAIEETQSKNHSTLDKVFSDKEAAFFLRVSTKKLQTLRNKREIGFVREPYGRKISYLYSHLMAYLKKNEIKAKK